MNKVFNMFPETMLETIRAATSTSKSIKSKSNGEDVTKIRELELKNWNWIGESDDEERPKDDIKENNRPTDGQPERGSPQNEKRKIRHANGNVADQVTLSFFEDH